MSYQQTTFIVNELIAEPLSDALMAHGALSAAIEDAYAGTDEEQAIFSEPGIESEQIWHNSKVLALFDEKADVAAIVAAAAEAVEIPTPAYQIELLPEQDWVRLTQAQFEPIKISDRLWITPSWHEAPDANAVNLQLDPGLAFGTGSHPTTRLCLQWLDNNLKGGESVLDYGCGSGILTIAALKLGAGSAVGVDIDPQAIAAGTNNAVQNRVETKFYLPDELPDGQFDVVVANILANPLRMLGEMLAARTKTGGRIVLSGLLEEQADELGGIYGQWFDLEPAIFDEGWACLSGVKR
ncbi:50S ribosomal protein L11 methyltransferase [Neisseria sp. P0008.S010]|uniref:50S ribosomal protein L11 methyltransferase n=1 Tax=Neisseria sp. P0008.S010 TaxID=3436707 RepID=UPI003F815B1E